MITRATDMFIGGLIAIQFVKGRADFAVMTLFIVAYLVVTLLFERWKLQNRNTK